MIDKLSQLVAAQDVGTWLIVALLVGYFVYKEWPDFRDRVAGGKLKETTMRQKGESLTSKVDTLCEGMKEVNEKLDRDYRRLNEFEKWKNRAQALDAEAARERALLIKALMACLDGLHQLGANGSTAEVRNEINDFLNETAHRVGP